MVNFMPWLLYPWNQSGRHGEEKTCPPTGTQESDPFAIWPVVSCCTDRTILAHAAIDVAVINYSALQIDEDSEFFGNLILKRFF
jgi:hypothetical protein